MSAPTENARLAVGCENRNAFVAVGETLPCAAQTLNHVLVQRVHLVRAFDRDQRDAGFRYGVADEFAHQCEDFALGSSHALNAAERLSRNAATPSRASGWWSLIAVFDAISSSACSNDSSAAL